MAHVIADLIRNPKVRGRSDNKITQLAESLHCRAVDSRLRGNDGPGMQGL